MEPSFTAIKLKEIFSKISNIYSKIQENYLSTIDSELYSPLILNYEEILNDNFNIKNYIKILLIVDKNIYILNKILSEL